jgi:NAD(P)-dependent dehydrogenase (short-subunit alcohol dehydrogenase family)
MKKTVFITGAAGGLGASATRYLAERDWHVFAADFDETALRVIGKEPNFITIPLEVTDPASVEAARALVAVVHAALTTAHPQIAYSVKPDLQRAALNRLPDCIADPLVKLALR